MTARREVWKKAADAVSKIGLTLPPHEVKGQVFTLVADGAVALHGKLQKNYWWFQKAAACKQVQSQ
jgi:hypothetical protein